MLPRLFYQRLSICALACLAPALAQVGGPELPSPEEFRAAYTLRTDSSLAESVPSFARLVERYEVGLRDASDDDECWSELAYCQHAVATHEVETGDWLAATARCEHATTRPMKPAQASLLRSVWSEALLGGARTQQATKQAEHALQLSDADQAQNGADYNKSAYNTAHSVLARCYLAMGLPELVVQRTEAFLAAEQAGDLSTGQLARAWIRLGTAFSELYFDGEQSSDQPALDWYARVLDLEECNARDRFAALARTGILHLRSGRLEAAREHLSAAGMDTAGFASVAESLGPVEHALLTALRARLARLSGAPAGESLDEACDQLVRHWRSQSDTKGVGFLRYGKARLIFSEQIETRLATQGASRALECVLKSQAVGFLYGALHCRTVDLEAARSCLDGSEQGCLCFFEGKDVVHVFGFDATSLIHTRVEGRYSFVEQCTELRAAHQAMANSPSDELAAARLSAAAAEVSARLLPRELTDLLDTWSHVVVCGRDMVDDIPLELLPLRGTPLGLGKAISDIPSFPVGVALQERHRGLGASLEKVRVLAAPDLSARALELDSGLAPLDTVLEDYADPFAPDRVTRLSGRDATATALLAAPTPPLVHVISHGVWDTAQESGAFTVSPDPLCEDGVLTAADIRELAGTSAALVLLTSCNGSAGTTYLGDAGASHLGGALIAKGANALVLSAADARVAARPALDFAAAVSGELESGERVDDAGLHARRALHERAGAAGLAYGAQWRVLGFGGAQLSMSRPTSVRRRWPLALGALLAALTAGALTVRARRRSR